MRPVFESRRGHQIKPIGYEKEAKGLFFILGNLILFGPTVAPQFSVNQSAGKILKNGNPIPILNPPKNKNLGQPEGEIPFQSADPER